MYTRPSALGASPWSTWQAVLGIRSTNSTGSAAWKLYPLRPTRPAASTFIPTHKTGTHEAEYAWKGMHSEGNAHGKRITHGAE